MGLFEQLKVVFSAFLVVSRSTFGANFNVDELVRGGAPLSVTEAGGDDPGLPGHLRRKLYAWEERAGSLE